MIRHIERLEPRRLLAAEPVPHVRFAVIGDYGLAGQAEEDVADLVKGWNPDFIVTTGDNNYPDGATATIDANVGQYYHEFIYNYTGTYGPGSPTRRFFPSLGNHDWNTPGAQPYLDYFDLPGNERYYDFAVGPVRFFLLDTDEREPDGVTSASVQAQWLEAQLAAASEPFKIVVGHHAPYSSSVVHGPAAYMQWPFEQWGATAVVTGHDHVYERLSVGGLPYFINGLGGARIYDFGEPTSGSEMRFNGDFGAMLADARDDRLRLKFFTRTGELIDVYTINAADPQPAKINLVATAVGASEAGADPAVFTFTRTGSTSGELTVNFALTGTAENGVDFTTIPTSVTFADGESTATVTIEPIDDALSEGDETVELTLLLSDDFNLGGATFASATIADDDGAEVIYVDRGATWRYLDDGSNQGTAWSTLSFDDAVWSSGPAQLGFGEGDEATVINGGPSNNRFVTHYFRRTFEVSDPTKLAWLAVELLRDDGAVLWINGHEAWRSNMPNGPIDWRTFASSVVGGADENRFFPQSLDLSLLVAGTNVLAVELHQANLVSSDASFDLRLRALLDIGPPPPPSTPDLDSSSDSGVSDSDDVTNDTTPTFTGTAEPGGTVRLFAGAVEIGSSVATDGTWTVTPTTPLADGIYAITATATDAAGNTSAPSPSLSVTIDTTPPALIASNFAFDRLPMAVTYAFDEAVDLTFSVDDIALENLTTMTVIDPDDMLLVFGDVTILLQFGGFPAGILPDGDYRATVAAAGVTDVAGNPLAQDLVLEFFFLNGDANRDRRVNLSDFNILAGHFGQSDRTFTQGDFNYDGTTNLDDFNLLASRFGHALVAPPAAPRPQAPAAPATEEDDERVADDVLS